MSIYRPVLDAGTRHLTFDDFRNDVLNDYRIAVVSREASLIGRKEVLTGKAKFGIFGDGKEVPQIAMAKAFRNGDYRSGYYRDQTFAFAIGALTVEQFFAQLYADPDVTREPASAGRQMNGHYATRMLNPDGTWVNTLQTKNIAADASPTSSQMPRSLGIALASKYYRQNNALNNSTTFSDEGNEVSFVTIGDASTSEGHFWETVNAAAVTQVPLAISIWDDGYGISVPIKYQTAQGSISKALAGMQDNGEGNGLDIYTVKGWDYTGLIETYQKAIARTRETHIPSLIHVQECTQPQGHSTSGSHERYKDKTRLEWERDFDCIKKMREWILANAMSTAEDLDTLEADAKQYARDAQKSALKAYQEPIKEKVAEATALMQNLANESSNETVSQLTNDIAAIKEPFYSDISAHVRQALYATRGVTVPAHEALVTWITAYADDMRRRYNSLMFVETSDSPDNIIPEPAEYDADAPVLNGFEILNKCFDAALTRDARICAFGEDVGKIGDVNQGFAGLQDKYSESRIWDTGIREATIIGQGIGMALRGLRPIAEIQYLDYLLFGLQPLSDDLATLHYRTFGGQKAPLIVRTRGHRLEGIWHTGSPMGMILNSIRGMHLCVPRNMVQAAGMYNTLLQCGDPALVIECLNGYRLKEKLPSNIDTFKVPLGIAEVLQQGTDVTLVTYGSCVRVAQEAMEALSKAGISVELIDVQTLLPFDKTGVILESLKKTNRIAFLDEDVPGGASAYMYREVIEKQGGFYHLDTRPITITAQAHRAAYANDGGYYSKPGPEDIFESIYNLMHEAEPGYYGKLF